MSTTIQSIALSFSGATDCFGPTIIKCVTTFNVATKQVAMAGRKPRHEASEILREFLLSTDPTLGTGELAEKFNYSKQGMNKRLRALENRGLIQSKKLGNVRAWWITEEGARLVAEDRDDYSAPSDVK
jgi:predicted transcriptional regulator